MANLPSSPGENAGRVLEGFTVRNEDEEAPDDDDEFSDVTLPVSVNIRLKVDAV